MKRSVVTLLLVISLLSICSPSLAQAASWQPILDRSLPDPFVYREGDYWYIFGTTPFGYGGAYGFAGKELSAEKMQRFKFRIDVGNPWRHYQVWGFKVYRHTDGTYHGYGAIHWGRYITEVVHFVPKPGQTWQPGKAIAEWKLDKKLVPYRGKRHPVSYDQNLLRDTDGTLYLLYAATVPRPGEDRPGEDKISDVHILARRMLDPGNVDPDFPPRTILRPEGYRSEDRNPNYMQIVEGCNIKRVADKWVLIYSVGDFKLYEGRPSNYKIGLAYSDQLIPPQGKTYQKVLLPDPDNVWQNDGKSEEVGYLLQSQIASWPNYCDRLVRGPGLGNIVQIDGRPWLVFHGYRPDAVKGNGNRREVWKLPLKIEISSERPMQQWIRAVLPETKGNK